MLPFQFAKMEKTHDFKVDFDGEALEELQCPAQTPQSTPSAIRRFVPLRLAQNVLSLHPPYLEIKADL